MRCQEFENKIMAFLAGKLAAEESRRFEDHAGECTRCGELLAEEQGLMQTFTLEEAGLAGDGFADRVMARLEASPEAEPIRWSFRPRRLAAAIGIISTLTVLATLVPEISLQERLATTTSAIARLVQGLGQTLTAGFSSIAQAGRSLALPQPLLSHNSPTLIAAATLAALVLGVGCILIFRKKISQEIMRT